MKKALYKIFVWLGIMCELLYLTFEIKFTPASNKKKLFRMVCRMDRIEEKFKTL